MNIMNTTRRILTLALIATLTIPFVGCKSEIKMNAYSDVYSEKPSTIYIAPLQDNSKRRYEKYPQDKAFNNELNTAAKFMHQTLELPLVNKGYYVMGPLVSEQIRRTEARSAKQMMTGDLKNYNTYYGIDAVLFATIHRWTEANGEWTVYVEYALRSTKTGTELLHNWVRATKRIPTDLKGYPKPLQSDVDYAARMKTDNSTAQRCFLVQSVNDYVLRNLPTSVLKWSHEDDFYKGSNKSYFSFLLDEDGSINIENLEMEEYENGCFLN